MRGIRRPFSKELRTSSQTAGSRSLYSGSDSVNCIWTSITDSRWEHSPADGPNSGIRGDNGPTRSFALALSVVPHRGACSRRQHRGFQSVTNGAGSPDLSAPQSALSGVSGAAALPGVLRGMQEELPRKKAARPTEEFSYTVAVIERSGKWIFRKGHGDPFLSDFWELPRIPGIPNESSEGEFFLHHHLNVRLLGGFVPIRHQITYRKLQFYPLRSQLSGHPSGPKWRWARLGETDLPVASYTRKILKRVEQQHGQKTFRYNSADDSG